MRMFIVILFIIAKTGNNYPLTGVCITKMWYIHALTYSSAIKRNATETYIYLINVMLEREANYKKLLYDPIHLKFKDRENESMVKKIRIAVSCVVYGVGVD